MKTDNMTQQQRKTDLINSILLVKDDTEKIIAHPVLRFKNNRIDIGMKSYTDQCHICNFKIYDYCNSCVFGVRKSCLNSYWHPPKHPAIDDFEKALKFLDYILPQLKQLPLFCFDEDYSDCLREYIECLDEAFKEEYQNPPEQTKHHKYKKENRLYQSLYNDKVRI